MCATKSKLNEFEKKNPFNTPSGYFERFTSEMMSKLPERAEAPANVVSLWSRMKPLVYMAAMFCGIALMFKIFTSNTGAPDVQSGLTFTSPSEIEDFYTYYEDQLAIDNYRQSLFIEQDSDSK